MREASKQSRRGKEKSNIPEQEQQKPDQNQHRPDQNRPGSGDQLDQGFNIDDILHLDVIPGNFLRCPISTLPQKKIRLLIFSVFV